MGSEWETLTTASLIKDGVLEIGDGYRAMNSELATEGIPFARAGNIAGGFDFEDADRVPDETLARVGRKKSQVGDVVFTSKGSVGRFAWVTRQTEPFVFSPQLCYWRICDEGRLLSRFLYYWMQGRECLHQIDALKGQTDMADYVSLRDQRAMRLTLPPHEEQRAVASVLGALDDKIESNRQTGTLAWQNAGLEFERHFGTDWAAKRFAGRPAPGTGGWGELRDIGELRYGKALKAADRQGGSVAVVGSNGVVGMHSERLVAGPAIVVGRKGTAGSVTWVNEDAWPIDTAFFATPIAGIGKEYLYFALLACDLPSLTADSAVPGLNRDAAYARPVVVPAADAHQEFVGAVQPLIALATATRRETASLTAVRDALLPKLVSGKLRVRDAEDLVEGASAA